MGRPFIFKKDIYLFIAVFSGILYLVSNEPKESILLIAFCIAIFKFKNTKGEKKVISKLTVVLIAYIISIVTIFNKSYKINVHFNDNINYKEEKAVVLVYKGEGEKYNIEKEVKKLKTHSNIKDKIKIPFILSSIKNSYRSIGKSDYKKNVLTIQRKLEERLSSKEYSVYTAFLNDNSYIEETLEFISNEGYKNIIIVPVFTDEDYLVEQLEERVNKMKLFNLNINVKYTDALINSEKLISIYVDKISRQINSEKTSYTGIVLIGSAQKDLQESVMFRNKIKLALQNHLNLDEHKVKEAWLKGSDLNYIKIVRDILEQGVSDIIVIYANPSVTNIENDKIIRTIKKKTNMPDVVKVKIIDGFLMEDEFIEDIKNRIEVLDLQKW